MVGIESGAAIRVNHFLGLLRRLLASLAPARLVGEHLQRCRIHLPTSMVSMTSAVSAARWQLGWVVEVRDGQQWIQIEYGKSGACGIRSEQAANERRAQCSPRRESMKCVACLHKRAVLQLVLDLCDRAFHVFQLSTIALHLVCGSKHRKHGEHAKHDRHGNRRGTYGRRPLSLRPQEATAPPGARRARGARIGR